MKQTREIIFYKHYFPEFYANQTVQVKEKIGYVFKVIRTVDKVPSKFLKHLTESNGLYEIRVEANSNIYRIFSCFDEGKIIVLFNGFQKKSNKTNKSELKKAKKLKDEYFKSKK